MAVAVPADVAERLGRELNASEAQIVQTRLDDAERIIMARIPDLYAKIIDGDIDRDALVMVESEMVLRLVRNPDGLRSETDGELHVRD